jgi:hypothetical protein
MWRQKRVLETQHLVYDTGQTRNEMNAANWHYWYEDDDEEPQVSFDSY